MIDRRGFCVACAAVMTSWNDRPVGMGRIALVGAAHVGAHL